MRALDLSLLVIVLSPLAALAQESPPAPPVASPVSAEAPALQAPPVPAPAATPPAATPPAAPPPATPPPPAAPPAAAFSPQPSPLVAPTYAYPSPQYYTAPAYQPAPPPPRPYYYVQQPEPPSYSLPPLPPGYVYMPVPIQQQTQVAPPAAAVADGARREQLYEELRRTDLRLSELQRQHIGVGGPITLMVLGYGTTMVSGLVALSSYNAADRIKRGNYSYEYDDELDVNNDGAINYRDSRKLRRMGRIALGVGAASLFVGISATVRLAKRRAERSKRAQELRSLTAERDGLRRQLDFGPALGAGHVGVRFQGRY